MKKNYAAIVLNALVQIFILLLILAMLSLPFLLHKYEDFADVKVPHDLFLIGFLYASAIPFFVLLLMSKKVVQKHP